MPFKKYTRVLIIIVVLLLLIGLGLAIAYFTGGSEVSRVSQIWNATDQELQTWMLVRAPDGPLPVNRPITVKSRSRDPNNHLSHVELYTVEIPTQDNAPTTQKVDLLIDTQFVPFEQTTFTANQTFTPEWRGEYVIKVVGYNINGDKSESEYIRFAVQ